MIQKGQSPLWLASRDGQSDIASLLLQHHAEVDLPEVYLPADVRHSNTMYTVHTDTRSQLYVYMCVVSDDVIIRITETLL